MFVHCLPSGACGPVLPAVEQGRQPFTIAGNTIADNTIAGNTTQEAVVFTVAQPELETTHCARSLFKRSLILKPKASEGGVSAFCVTDYCDTCYCVHILGSIICHASISHCAIVLINS